MKIYDTEQRSIEWGRLHIGKVTASEFGNLVTPLMKERDGETPKTYLSKKLCEAYRGEPLCTLSPELASSFAMEQGTLLEEEILPFLSLEYDMQIKTVGFCEHDNGIAGCSPDGLLGEDGGLEVKGPQPHTHCAYLLAGVVPPIYLPQIHFSLYVTGRKYWTFVSYRRKFPTLIVRVERDEAVMAKIDGIVHRFNAELLEAVAKLKSLK